MIKTGGLLLMILLNAFLINKAVIQHGVIKIPSYMVGLIFIVLSLPLIHLNLHWGVTISTSILILTYHEIINLSDSINIKKTVFKTGFFVGTLIMIDYHFIWLYLIIIISLPYYAQFNWRNCLIQLIGLIYPFGFYYSLSASNYHIPTTPFDLDLSFNQLDYYFYDYYPFLFGILILLMLSMIELYRNYYRKKENAKKAFNFLFIFIIVIILKTLFLDNLKFIHLLIVPGTILIANYLIYSKHKKFRTFLLGLLFILFTLKFFQL
tara:strand:- start:728 stop:1522 length:795 start_codon:yes stop_codon:yes gene_type:complete